MKHLRSLSLCLIVIGLMSAAVAPAPPQDDVIDAEATSIIHIDVQTAVASRFGHLMLHEDLFNNDMRESFDAFEEETGISVERDVKSITVYGNKLDDGGSVVVAVTNSAVDAAIARLAEREEYRSVTIDGHTCHVWEEGCGWIDRRGEEERLVVLTENLDALERAIAVIDGDRESASVAEALGERRPREGAFLYGVFLNPAQHITDDADADDPISRIAAYSKATFVQMGERGDEVFAAVAVEAENADRAGDVVEIAEGLIALGKIIADAEESASDAREIRELLNGVSFRSDGATITAEVELPVATFEEDETDGS